MPKLDKLNGQQLYAAISVGIKNLVAHQKTLDEINVFPVPDGDTGTNLAFTLIPILTEHKNHVFERVDETMEIIANTALESARGNSGTIIAQFYYGLKKSFEGIDILEIKNFADGLQQGYESAIASLANPEGGPL